MANNIAVTPGSGATLRTDDLTGSDRHMPFTRLDGGSGTTENNITAGSKTSANSLPVVIASDQAAVAVKGADATGAALTGNPVPAGAEARASRRSGESTGDVLPLQGNAIGYLVVEPYALAGDKWNASAVITSTSDVTVKASDAGLRQFLTHLSLTNDSGSAIRATLYDGTSAGTVIGRWLLPSGGGISLDSPSGFVGTAGNAVTLAIGAAPSGTVPSGGTAAVLMTATGYRGV